MKSKYNSPRLAYFHRCLKKEHVLHRLTIARIESNIHEEMDALQAKIESECNHEWKIQSESNGFPRNRLIVCNKCGGRRLEKDLDIINKIYK